MREIKFRIWDLQSKYFSSEYDIYCSNGIVCCNNRGIVDPSRQRFVPQQYTGLKDKNGKEIYEGDIVKFHPWNSPQKGLENYLCKSLKQIKWGLDSGEYPSVGFVAINLQPADLEDGHQINWMDARNMEVIGNIFENSELLEK